MARKAAPLIRSMAAVATECVKSPGRTSIWSKKAGKYVCSKDPEYREATHQQTAEVSLEHPPINQTFKLVFLTSAFGTVFFTGLCLVVHWATGGVMPTATQKLVDGMLSMAQIGAGAVFGLLGAQGMKASAKH
jgi:hypothetical protein